MSKNLMEAEFVGDQLDRSLSRRDLGRMAAFVGAGAAVAAIGGPVLAAGAAPAARSKPTMKTGLPRTPEAFFPAMEERFNSLDVATALELFHEDAIFVDGMGTVHHGKAAIGAELAKYFGTGLKMDLRPGHVFTSGDTTLSINDWSYDGKDKDGKPVKMSGSTSDVLRRSADGVWRYVIDNPFGNAVGR